MKKMFIFILIVGIQIVILEGNCPIIIAKVIFSLTTAATLFLFFCIILFYILCFYLKNCKKNRDRKGFFLAFSFFMGRNEKSCTVVSEQKI